MTEIVAVDFLRLVPLTSMNNDCWSRWQLPQHHYGAVVGLNCRATTVHLCDQRQCKFPGTISEAFTYEVSSLPCLRFFFLYVCVAQTASVQPT